MPGEVSVPRALSSPSVSTSCVFSGGNQKLSLGPLGVVGLRGAQSMSASEGSWGPDPSWLSALCVSPAFGSGSRGLCPPVLPVLGAVTLVNRAEHNTALGSCVHASVTTGLLLCDSGAAGLQEGLWLPLGQGRPLGPGQAVGSTGL